jgi:hypothetical protein
MNRASKVIAVLSAAGLISFIVGVNLLLLDYSIILCWALIIIGAFVLLGGLLFQLVIKKVRRQSR